MKFPHIALGVSLVAVLCSVGQLLAQQGDTNSVVEDLSFPSGVTVQTASNIQISSAVKTAILNHPELAKRIVSETIKQIAKGGRLVPQKLPSETRGAIVSRILVKEGDPIRTGQTLALMEINGQKMKFTATADGAVDAIIMTPGPVTAGDGPLAVISQTAAQARQAIRYVILGAAVAAPASIADIVEAATQADPESRDLIVRTATEALPSQSAQIAAAAPPPKPPHSPALVGTNTDNPTKATTADESKVDSAPQTPTPAQREMKDKMDDLKAHGKLTDASEVGKAVQAVVDHNTVTKEVPAPLGAKVIAVYKKKGDVVLPGDKLVLLRLPDGKEFPILAKEGGIMQALSVSKGGVIGNTHPRSAFLDLNQSGVILIAMSPLPEVFTR